MHSHICPTGGSIYQPNAFILDSHVCVEDGSISLQKVLLGILEMHYPFVNQIAGFPYV